MTTVRKVIGRLPVLIGDWDSDYREGQGYMKNNRVLIFNSELQSKIDNNTYPPATQNLQTGVITFDTTHWVVVSDGRNTIGLAEHVQDTSNPHNVTKSQVGLGNVVNTGDSDTPVSGGTTKFTTGGAYVELAKKADKTEVYTKTEGQALETSVNSAITTQQAKIDALDSHEVIVGTLPSTGVAGKIYRVPDNPEEGQYTDYGYNTGALSTPVKIATYQMPGIDNEPTAGSDNLVKSGGVASEMCLPQTLINSNPKKFFTIVGHYTKNSGTWIGWGNYFTSPFINIQCLSGAIIAYSHNSGASANRITLFTGGKDSDYLASYNNLDDIIIDTIISQYPTATHIRFSILNTYFDTFNFTPNLVDIYEDVDKDASKLWLRSDISVFSKNERYEIGTGNLVLWGNYWTTPFMVLSNLAGAKFSYDFSSDSTNAITLFDSSRSYVANVQNTSNVEIDNLIASYPTAKYIRISIFNQNYASFKAYKSNVEMYKDIQEISTQLVNMASLPKQKSAKIFRRVGCIGDSYTAGYIQIVTPALPNNTYPLWSWPHYMKQLTGETWENWGKGGSTAKSWVEGYANLDQVQAVGNKCQAYIIGLGINDLNTGNPYYTPVGVIGDIGTDNDTYYAYYYKLIKAVVAVNEEAKIFCCTCPKSKTDANYIPYNQAVRDVVEYCHDTENLNVFLCDLADEKYNNPSVYDNIIYTRELINEHYTPIGYEFMAECFLYVLSDVVNENYLEMRNVFEIDYDVT